MMIKKWKRERGGGRKTEREREKREVARQIERSMSDKKGK